MTEQAIRQAPRTRPWPMTADSWRRLIDELERLRSDVAELASSAPPEAGIVHLPMAHASRRLDTLTEVLEFAETRDDADCAVIGRHVTLREDDGETARFTLVFPGDGDPGNGRISADSPLGAALLGARMGDVVEVVAPAGRRRVAIVAVD